MLRKSEFFAFFPSGWKCYTSIKSFCVSSLGVLELCDALHYVAAIFTFWIQALIEASQPANPRKGLTSFVAAACAGPTRARYRMCLFTPSEKIHKYHETPRIFFVGSLVVGSGQNKVHLAGIWPKQGAG